MDTPCIYRIRNLVTGHVYIGQTRNPQGRWTQHQYTLRTLGHSCRPLQMAWLEGEPQDFVFEIVEVLPDDAPRDDLLRAEKQHIEALPADECYNRMSYQAPEERRALRTAKQREEILSYIEQMDAKKIERLYRYLRGMGMR